MNIFKYSFLVLLSLVFSLNSMAQVNLQTILLYGKVTSQGQGIENVAVTDGINVVSTNSGGEYSLLTNATTDFVYITIPAGHKVPIENKIPLFYHRLTDKSNLKQEFNFHLEKLPDNEDKHTLVVWADPQVYQDEDLIHIEESAKDVKVHLQEIAPNTPAYGMVVGDIVGDANAEPRFYDRMKDIIGGADIPFFYLPGNHDILYYVRSDRPSKEIYKQTFGPTYYSFNRGKIHYIVLDNCFYNGNLWYYIGYLPETQLEWLEQDLARVEKGSTVVVSMHIPAYSQFARKGEWGKEKPSAVLQNRSHLFKMFEGYNVHVMSGHVHETDNYIIQNNIYEHNHPAICGLFYESELCKDGTPRGYAVYQFDGDSVQWHYKAVGLSDNVQFKLYNVGEHHQKPESIVANVWNYDSAWKVYWYEDGVKIGEMKQFSGIDTEINEFVKNNRQNFKHSWANAGSTDHLFFATPNSASSAIKVEVIDRFGNIFTQEISNKEK